MIKTTLCLYTLCFFLLQWIEAQEAPHLPLSDTSSKLSPDLIRKIRLFQDKLKSENSKCHPKRPTDSISPPSDPLIPTPTTEPSQPGGGDAPIPDPTTSSALPNPTTSPDVGPSTGMPMPDPTTSAALPNPTTSSPVSPDPTTSSPISPDPTTSPDLRPTTGGSWVGDKLSGPPDHDFKEAGGVVTLSMKNSGTRAYQRNGKSYVKYDLTGKTFSFDVDLSKVPCGYNFAVYFSAFADKDASSGSGYCDANGVGGGWCNELDILEGNVEWGQFTSHSCQGSSCDPSGSFEHIHWSEYGIDGKSKFTIQSSFKDNTMTQVLIQNGKTSKPITLTDTKGQGGFPEMFKQFKNGMALIVSIWGSGPGTLGWLDKNCNTLSSMSRSEIQGSASNFKMG